MSVREIRTFGDPVLREACSKVSDLSRVEHLVADLKDTCELPGRAGVAANQIGVALRVFSYAAEGANGYLINPEILILEGEPSEIPEGCLSLPGLWFDTPRYPRVRVAGLLLDGTRVELECEGLLAQVMQHECDHLEGKLFIDRLSPELRKQALAELRTQQQS